MGLKGILIGGSIGSLFGGPLGALLGAVFGSQIEKTIARGRAANARGGSCSGYAGMPSHKRSMIFCASAAAMLAKMAKADGRVSRDEINRVEQAFVRLGFSPAARSYAIEAFRRAKDDSHTIFEYAEEFALAVGSLEVREFFYEILWDIAAADGAIRTAEFEVLQRIPRALGIRSEWYGYYYSRYAGDSSRRGSADSLQEAYALLGARAEDDVETLRSRYRELAKRHHPDSLLAQGLPKEMIDKATERMSRINEAWAAIRSARGI